MHQFDDYFDEPLNKIDYLLFLLALSMKLNGTWTNLIYYKMKLT